MRTAIDSNVVSAIWSWEPMAEKLVEQLGEARREGALIISPFAFAELHGYPNVTGENVRKSLEDTNVVIDLNLAERVWNEAGMRFARYADRRRKTSGASPKRLLADFLIGAHALVQADRLLTLDPRRYRQDFPELRLM